MTVLTLVSSEKISNSSIRDIYSCCGLRLETYTVNPVAPQFVYHGFSTVEVLNKGTGIWSPATRIRRLPDFTHWILADQAAGQSAAVGESVGAKLDYSE